MLEFLTGAPSVFGDSVATWGIVAGAARALFAGGLVGLLFRHRVIFMAATKSVYW
jgi:hypothetical protein